MPELITRAMTEPEFDAWRDHSARGFADEQVAAGTWTADEAFDRARHQVDSLLPDGFATPGMLFLQGVRPDGVPVGMLWISLTHPRGVPSCAYLYDIEVADEHRGAGYGRALLAAGEDAARAHGSTAMELNVFGANTRATRLYETSGYAVVTQQLRKTLSNEKHPHNA